MAELNFYKRFGLKKLPPELAAAENAVYNVLSRADDEQLAMIANREPDGGPTERFHRWLSRAARYERARRHNPAAEPPSRLWDIAGDTELLMAEAVLHWEARREGLVDDLYAAGLQLLKTIRLILGPSL